MHPWFCQVSDKGTVLADTGWALKQWNELDADSHSPGKCSWPVDYTEAGW